VDREKDSSISFFVVPLNPTIRIRRWLRGWILHRTDGAYEVYNSAFL